MFCCVILSDRGRVTQGVSEPSRRRKLLKAVVSVLPIVLAALYARPEWYRYAESSSMSGAAARESESAKYAESLHIGMQQGRSCDVTPSITSRPSAFASVRVGPHTATISAQTPFTYFGDNGDLYAIAHVSGLSFPCVECEAREAEAEIEWAAEQQRRCDEAMVLKFIGALQSAFWQAAHEERELPGSTGTRVQRLYQELKHLREKRNILLTQRLEFERRRQERGKYLVRRQESEGAASAARYEFLSSLQRRRTMHREHERTRRQWEQRSSTTGRALTAAISVGKQKSSTDVEPQLDTVINSLAALAAVPPVLKSERRRQGA